MGERQERTLDPCPEADLRPRQLCGRVRPVGYSKDGRFGASIAIATASFAWSCAEEGYVGWEMPQVLSYGSPDAGLIDLALTNFTKASFSPLSFSTTPVEVVSLDGDETRLSHATGFYWHHAGVDFVVTNWHAISGRDVFTGELLDARNRLIPRKIRVFGWRLEPAGESRLEMRRTGWTVDLGEHGMELFAEPPKVDSRLVDIAAVPMPPGFVIERSGVTSKGGYDKIEPRINLREYDKIASQAGDDVVLMGYPLGQYSGLQFPIWKRGSLAIDTNMTLDGLPAFLVDAATSKAMSGSPIFRLVGAPAEVDPATKVVSQFRAFQFLGVYGGRLLSADLAATNLGYGWLGNQVDAAVALSWSRWQSIIKNIVAEQDAEPG